MYYGKRNHTAKGLHRESSYFGCNSIIKTAFVGHLPYVIVHIICMQYHVMFYQNSINYAYSYTHFLGGKNRLQKLKEQTAKKKRERVAIVYNKQVARLGLESYPLYSLINDEDFF